MKKTINRKKQKNVDKKRPRADSQRNRKTVALEVAKNPNASIRDLAKSTGLAKSTVQKKMDELGTIKDEAIVNICNKDLAIVELGQKIILDKLKDEEIVSKLKPSEISSVISENTKRYMLFKGDATDYSGGLKNNISELSDSELLDLLKNNQNNEKKE